MKFLYGLIVASILILSAVFYLYARPLWVPVYQKVVGKVTVSDIVEHYGADAQERLVPYFEKAGVSFPPSKVTMLAIKDTDVLELWASSGESFSFIRTYSVLAASGESGPKLREGDKQVPEGIYQLEYLNPNSSYHLSMKLNYPNQFDMKHARSDGRDEPGTNIFIHGKAVSIGCLAMGDTAIEELFVLTAMIGQSAIEVAIAPSDPRINDISLLTHGHPAWVEPLYNDITRYFNRFKHTL
jgi:hypothetical protein